MDWTIDQYNFTEPISIEIQQDSWDALQLRQTAIKKAFSHFLMDVPRLEKAKAYRFATFDNTVAFTYIYHPVIGALIVPPNAIELDPENRNKWVGNSIQKYLETHAKENHMKLMAWVTLDSAAAFNQRVIHILRGIGYHIGPPSNISEIHYCIHDSTYDGKWIPEIPGMEKEYFIPPTNKKNKN